MKKILLIIMLAFSSVMFADVVEIPGDNYDDILNNMINIDRNYNDIGEVADAVNENSEAIDANYVNTIDAVDSNTVRTEVNADAIKSESEIRGIIDNNLAKGIDANATAIINNTENINNSSGVALENKIKSEAKFRVDGDAKLAKNIKDNSEIQSIIDEAIIETVDSNIVKIDGNSKLIKSESEIRNIVDNNLAKGIDANTELVNTEAKYRADADYKLSSRIEDNSKEIVSLRDDMRSGVAGVAAMANMDFRNIEVGSIGIGAGYGGYDGANAAALGLGLRPTENLTVRGSVAYDGNMPVYGAGVTYELDLF